MDRKRPNNAIELQWQGEEGSATGLALLFFSRLLCLLSLGICDRQGGWVMVDTGTKSW